MIVPGLNRFEKVGPMRVKMHIFMVEMPTFYTISNLYFNMFHYFLAKPPSKWIHRIPWQKNLHEMYA